MSVRKSAEKDVNVFGKTKGQTGELVAALCKTCMEMNMSGPEAVFAMGIAAQSLMRIGFGPDREPTDDDKEMVLALFVRGMEQEVMLLARDGGPAAEFGGVFTEGKGH
jgi:hypothetical protein